MGKNQIEKISIGIPTFNSSKYLSDCLKSLEKFKTFNEIIISDDCSNLEDQKKIEEIVNFYKKKLPVYLIKNQKNLGAYQNKLSLIKASKNEYIYILDSDNIAGKNFDKIVKEHVLVEKRKDIIFQPNIMYQFWRYPKTSKILGSFIKKYRVKFFNNDTFLDIEEVKKSLLINSGDYDLNVIEPGLEYLKEKNEKDILETKWIFWVLNCGNFIVNKNSMIEVAEKGLEFNRSLRSVDAIVFSYLWLDYGNKIKIPKNFYHHHRKRDDSVSFVEKEDSKNAILFFIKKVLNH